MMVVFLCKKFLKIVPGYVNDTSMSPLAAPTRCDVCVEFCEFWGIFRLPNMLLSAEEIFQPTDTTRPCADDTRGPNKIEKLGRVCVWRHLLIIGFYFENNYI